VAGDQIDFVVGRGADDSYISDHTGLEATIVAVPEPSRMILTICMLGLLTGALKNTLKSEACRSFYCSR
jgi:hypothetical protein